MSESRNSYLDEVLAQQERLESDLRRSAPPPPPAPSAAPFAQAPGAPAAVAARSARVRAKVASDGVNLGGMPGGGGGSGGPGGSGGSDTGHNGVEVRVTGVGRWKTVLVPPNAFVVHTRRGQADPLHVGLGVSFRFNPAKDTFLVVPGAMQTILLNAFCICRELQGILVQAYVQWIIDDFSVAYRKLDFSDPLDPMRLVNLQLREQAEAAIKDKVATMSIEEVLSDRQPIIEELTARLRAVAEGEGGGQGLGLRIVTVQIKEAVVSSKTLWENLQKPFRAEQGRLAALAELAADGVVTESRMAEARRQEERRLADERDLTDLRAGNAAAAFEREAADQAQRDTITQENARKAADAASETRVHALELERQRHEQESVMARLRLEEEQELVRMRLEADLASARARVTAQHETALLELDRQRLRAEIDNGRSEAALRAELIEALPGIVEKLPSPAEYKSVTIGGSDSATLAGLAAQLSAIVNVLKDAI